MKTYKIPVEWASMGYALIDAENVNDAIRIFDDTMDEIPLDDDPTYIDGSYQMSDWRGFESREDMVLYYSDEKE